MAFTNIQEKYIADLIKKHQDEHDKISKKEISQLTKENKELRKTLDKLEKKLSIVETDLFELSKELELTKKATFINDQYTRRNNLEISGIPHEIEDDLEKVCISLINNIIGERGEPYNGVNAVCGSDIEACHRLMTVNNNKVNNTIIRFKNRKHCDLIYENKKKISLVVNEKLGDSVKNIYINENLCGYYKLLAAKSRRLKKRRKITDTWISYGTVKLKLKDGSTKSITHENDLERLFPGFVYFT